MMEFIENNNLDVIHIAVDGVVSANPAMIVEDKVLGEWELSNISPCICSGTGNVALEGNPNGNDFSLTYHKVKELIDFKLINYIINLLKKKVFFYILF